MYIDNNSTIITDKSSLKELIKKAIQEYFETSQDTTHESEEYISRHEAKDILNTTYPTLWRWNKIGYLKAYKIGNKVVYKKTDINTLINK